MNKEDLTRNESKDDVFHYKCSDKDKIQLLEVENESLKFQVESKITRIEALMQDKSFLQHQNIQLKLMVKDIEEKIETEKQQKIEIEKN